MEAAEARWDLSSTEPSRVAQGFLFFTYTFSLSSFSHTTTREHTCLCVQHAYSLHVNGNPGNLLTSPSGTFDDHSLLPQR